MKRLHARIDGHVQGVYFRDHVRTHAQRLHLTGWVTNSDDGSVEVVAEGEDVALAQFVLLLEKGSPMSRVDDVQVRYVPPTGEYADFTIR